MDDLEQAMSEEQWTFTGSEGLSRLLDIFLAGVQTGTASAIYNIMPRGFPVGAETARIMRDIRRDPAVMMVMEERLRDYLAGRDPEPARITVRGGPS